MEHLGAHHLHQGQAEPISFGIDQILSGPEPPGGGAGPARAAGEPDYGLYGGGYGPACSLGSYNLNMSMNVSVNVTPAPAAPPAGVIRVPAHRPAPAAPPAAPPPVPGLSGLTFPWMETTRRIAKDRLSGERRRDGSRTLLSAPTAPGGSDGAAERAADRGSGRSGLRRAGAGSRGGSRSAGTGARGSLPGAPEAPARASPPQSPRPAPPSAAVPGAGLSPIPRSCCGPTHREAAAVGADKRRLRDGAVTGRSTAALLRLPAHGGDRSRLPGSCGQGPGPAPWGTPEVPPRSGRGLGLRGADQSRTRG